MRISELAARTQASAHALRHYEGLGLIHAARSAGGYRLFAESVVREVLLILMCRRIGFSLKEIALWLPAYRAGRLSASQMIDMLHERIAQIDTSIAEQRQQRQLLVQHVAWLKKRVKRPAESSAKAWVMLWAA
jgi:MerR family transcriptional regulator, copper efflux regulator